MSIAMLKSSWPLALFLSAWLPCAALAQAVVEPGHWKIGVLAYKGKAAALQRWQAHGDYLSQRLDGDSFQIIPLSYRQDEMTHAVAAGEVDFIITNPGHYTELELEGLVSRLATRRVASPAGVLDQFGGTVIARPERSDLNSYADLAGKTVLIPSTSSLGGWQVHLREALSQGLDLRRTARIVELKNHHDVVQAILAGEGDVGFVRSDLIEGMVARGELSLDQLKVVNRQHIPDYPYLLSTRLYPEWPFAMVKGTSMDTAKTVLQALLSMQASDPAAQSAGIQGWTIPGDYSAVGELFRETGLGPYARQTINLETVLKRYWRELGVVCALGVLALSVSTWRSLGANRALRGEIHERELAEQKIVHQAHFDTLTDLPNRLLSLDRLTQMLKNARRCREQVAVMFLDLDDFKKINDTMGHETGDKLLVEAANRLKAVVRGDDTVGRLGGDEFIILLGGLENAVDAGGIAENVLQTFNQAFRIDGREMMLTASVGIAIYPGDGDCPSELLRNADSAMYHSKDLGRNTYSYFTNTMNEQVSRRLSVEEHLHAALGNGEFRLCFQPQVDIQTGRMTGAEVLLRWSNPSLGEVSPEEFIPVAEHTGLIVPIGQFVLRQALATARHWQQTYGRDLKISVNLSPRQFRDPQLVSLVVSALRDSGLAASGLELEITEGVLLAGHRFIHEALDQLHVLGVSIAMDDFGTGYSSLSYLRNYPFHVMKIDRSFVQDIARDQADRELINASIAMAHGLGLRVVAEGVETEDQLSYLADQGCDYAQGYLFGAPVSVEAMSAMLAQEQGQLGRVQGLSSKS